MRRRRSISLQRNDIQGSPQLSIHLAQIMDAEHFARSGRASSDCLGYRPEQDFYLPGWRRVPPRTAPNAGRLRVPLSSWRHHSGRIARFGHCDAIRMPTDWLRLSIAFAGRLALLVD